MFFSECTRTFDLFLQEFRYIDQGFATKLTLWEATTLDVLASVFCDILRFLRVEMEAARVKATVEGFPTGNPDCVIC